MNSNQGRPIGERFGLMVPIDQVAERREIVLTFYRIADIDRFFKVVDACNSGIFFQPSEGQYVDIRKNSFMKKLLEKSCGRQELKRLDLHVACADDVTRLLQYMMAGR